VSQEPARQEVYVGGVGEGEFLLLLVIGAVILGPERLPRYAAQLGQFVRRFRGLGGGSLAQLREQIGPDSTWSIGAATTRDSMTLAGSCGMPSWSRRKRWVHPGAPFVLSFRRGMRVMGRGLFEGWHLVILVALSVLLVGFRRLPDAARSLGRSMRIFKSEVDEMKSDGKSPASQDTVKGKTVHDHGSRAA
jgi:sec-independent protein translocase protein TatA